MYKKTIK